MESRSVYPEGTVCDAEVAAAGLAAADLAADSSVSIFSVSFNETDSAAVSRLHLGSPPAEGVRHAVLRDPRRQRSCLRLLDAEDAPRLRPHQ